MTSRARFTHDSLVIGQTVAFGRKTVTREEIVAWGRAFDPQPAHLDEEHAKATMIGRLCASGWQSCTILMRMIVDELMGADSASLGSPGVDEVRFVKPVFPGDSLSARFTCTAKRELVSKPGVGLSKITFEMVNQAGDVVLVWYSNQFLKIASAAGTGDTA